MNTNHKILIEDIEREPDKTMMYKLEGAIDELDNCNIKADLRLQSLGEYIKVTGEVEGVVQLECDRCLSKFDYELEFDIAETFAKHSLYEEYGQEVELQSGQFITDLNGEKEIDIYDLLYQYVILNLPNKKVCGINCNEGMFLSDDEIKPHDERMNVFKTIKIERQN